MNLKRSQRMQKLVDIETQQSQPVIAKFKADQVALQQQEQALQNLLTYREEYTEKFKAQGNAGASAFKMHDFYCFLQKLDDAIVQQRQVLVNLAQQLEHSRLAWQRAHQRIEALQQVTDQSDQQEKTLARKQSQRQLEERFGLMAPEVFST
ncbi:flagellar export protein FliJ [Pseudomonadales bacterium]|jgi:flagellar FliJ protein|nr:flagellar export protein FliJ [Pseudomonadales bacterium]MDB3986595.1 flagellar export protein FliJ [Pseudomonadales bacterium]MDC1238867.1 flagellar export protein FliJ [Pseudomonadales bacterium]